MSKHAVWRAYQKVTANQGAAGVDAEASTDGAGNLKDKLSKMGNRMAAGSDVPPPVRAVGIPPQSGGTRRLGMPPVGDRVAQLVAQESLAPCVAPQFHPDASGSRPGKAALPAVAVTRTRCWRDDWGVDYASQPLGASSDPSRRLRAGKQHTDGKGLRLSLESWLNAPRPGEDGQLIERPAGTPPGGVGRPVLANLLLPEGLDHWRDRPFPAHRWAR